MLSGSDLKAIRENAGISQIDMAKKLGCDRRTIINYEQGTSEPKVKRLLNWLSLCKINVSPILEQINKVKNISLLIFTVSYFNPNIVSPIYISTLFIALIFSIAIKRKELALTSISLIMINAMGFILFAMGYIESLYPPEVANYISYDIYFYIIQITLNTSFFFLFKDKSKSTKIANNYCSSAIFEKINDLLISYIFLYYTSITSLALIESLLRSSGSTPRLSVIYNNYESLIYIGWIFTLSVLASSIMVSLKNKSFN